MEGEPKIPAPSDGQIDGVQRIRALHGRTTGPTRRSTKGNWTTEEDEILRKAVQRFKGKNWKKIAECFKDRTDVQCLHRWQKVLNPELIKGPWSKEEDEVIIDLVNKYGPKKWSTIAQHLPGRIGKQCRERWHNHLNPAINKEAWTQEEELTLIRAHQIYGNRWAELTKFLPGRTDNSIKNHWHSSVKKKLDSYLASGLLTQLQSLPHVRNHPMQSSGDDNGSKRTEGEDVSECSQESANPGHFPSAREMINVDLQTREEFRPNEESSLGKDQSLSQPSCSAPYFMSLDDMDICIPEIACRDACSSQFTEQKCSHELPDSMSVEFQLNCAYATEICDMVDVPVQTALGLGVSTSTGPASTNSVKPDHMLISDEECCRVLFSAAINDGCFSGDCTKGVDIVDLSGCKSFLCQSCGIQIPETGGTSTSQLTCPHCSNKIEGTSSSQSVPQVLSASDGKLVCTTMAGRDDQQFVSGSQENNIFANGESSSTCIDGMDSAVKQEPPDILKDTSKLSPINSFDRGSNSKLIYPSDEKPNVHLENKDTGTLCFEPPSFPSLDIPFFSCDLVQSGSDMQQEFSPLGIRQFLLSPMACLSPLRLWDSPSRDDCRDALLKSAAKNFTGTTSILKKRHRDLLTPLSDKRIEKKLETDMTSSLTKSFSNLDFIFYDNGNREADMFSPSSLQKQNSAVSVDVDKENFGQSFKGAQVEEKIKSAILDEKKSENSTVENNSQDKTKHPVDPKMKKIDIDAAAEIVQQPSGVLVEHDMNDLLLLSPDHVGFKSDTVLNSSARTPQNLSNRRLEVIPNQSNISKSPSDIPCSSAKSLIVRGKEHEKLTVSVTCASVFSSAAAENSGEQTGNDGGFETNSIFGGTPFRKSLASPSAWKSPWFINTIVCSPKFNTDITIEDYGYFMSPGNRNYDAIGWIKQISEQTAAAHDILRNETPKALPKDVSRNDKENNCPNEQPGKHSQSASSVLMERRILDFSECGTPGKADNSKSSPVNFSSTSYLLKGCR